MDPDQPPLICPHCEQPIWPDRSMTAGVTEDEDGDLRMVLFHADCLQQVQAEQAEAESRP